MNRISTNTGVKLNIPADLLTGQNKKIPGYNKACYEDDTTNRLAEDIGAFEEICRLVENQKNFLFRKMF